MLISFKLWDLHSICVWSERELETALVFIPQGKFISREAAMPKWLLCFTALSSSSSLFLLLFSHTFFHSNFSLNSRSSHPLCLLFLKHTKRSFNCPTVALRCFKVQSLHVWRILPVRSSSSRIIIRPIFWVDLVVFASWSWQEVRMHSLCE